MSLAPIVLFVYNRPDHTKQTIKALQKNELAKESELFIYSDEAINEDVRTSVDQVRDYIDSIDGFKKITVIKREKNWGLDLSIINGVTNIVQKYRKTIVLEDDLVTSPYFLKFMNEALAFYEYEEKIFTVSGYSNIDIPKQYKKDIYFAHISSSWGWATWKNRWESVQWDNKYYNELFENKKELSKIESKIGNFRMKLFELQMNGVIDVWDIRRLFSQLIQDKMTIFPSETLVNNIGFDGSGVHCGDDATFDKNNRLSTAKIFNFVPWFESSLINKLIYQKNHVTFFQKVVNKLKRIFTK